MNKEIIINISVDTENVEENSWDILKQIVVENGCIKLIKEGYYVDSMNGTRKENSSSTQAVFVKVE